MGWLISAAFRSKSPRVRKGRGTGLFGLLATDIFLTGVFAATERRCRAYNLRARLVVLSFPFGITRKFHLSTGLLGDRAIGLAVAKADRAEATSLTV